MANVVKASSLCGEETLRASTAIFLFHKSLINLSNDDDVFYLFLQKQNLGAKLHIYL
jgi:hypothetical protein